MHDPKPGDIVIPPGVMYEWHPNGDARPIAGSHWRLVGRVEPYGEFLRITYSAATDRVQFDMFRPCDCDECRATRAKKNA